MSLTPKTPIPEGAIRYNTDSNKMEVWIGDKWMIVSVSSPNLDGGARGVMGGGRYPHQRQEMSIHLLRSQQQEMQ